MKSLLMSRITVLLASAWLVYGWYGLPVAKASITANIKCCLANTVGWENENDHECDPVYDEVLEELLCDAGTCTGYNVEEWIDDSCEESINHHTANCEMLSTPDEWSPAYGNYVCSYEWCTCELNMGSGTETKTHASCSGYTACEDWMF